MNQNESNCESRRSFLKSTALALSLVPMSGALSNVLAAPAKGKGKTPGNLPAGASAVDMNDMMVKNMKYSHNATDVWGAEGKAKHCSGCSFYTTSNADWGKCTLFAQQQGLVYKEGSCISFNKKA